jgi:hypothetical protein
VASLLSVAALLVISCGQSIEEQRSERADEVRAELEKLPYEVEIEPAPKWPGYPSGTGVVFGSITSLGGSEVRFWYSMGPSPENLPGRGIGSKTPTGAVDDFSLKVSPIGESSRRSRVQLGQVASDLADLGCRVTTDEHCPI